MKCLVTKLKGEVQGDLPLFGKVVINQAISVNVSGSPYTDGNFYFKAKISGENSYFTVGSDSTHYTELDISGDVRAIHFVKAENEDAYIEFDMLNTSLVFGIIDFDKLYGDNIVYIKCPRTSTLYPTGSINNLSEYCPKLKCIEADYCDSITGNIKTAFGKLINLQAVYQNSNVGVTGSLDELAQEQINNGRTSGTLNMMGNGVITWLNNGVETVTTNGQFYHISFSGSTYTITV